MSPLEWKDMVKFILFKQILVQQEISFTQKIIVRDRVLTILLNNLKVLF